MNDDTTSSFVVIRSEMEKNRKRKRLFRVFSLILAFLCLIYIALYFSLPVFQASSASYEGLVNFSKEDMKELAEIKDYDINLLFDTKKARENALENSHGFLLEADYETNGLTTKASIQENYPVASYQDTIYFADGSSLSDSLAKVSLLPLSEERKTALKENLTRESQDKLPVVHLPSSLPEGYDLKEAFEPLSGVSQEALKAIAGIAYINEGKDAKWSNVAYALVYDEENSSYYLLKNLSSAYFSSYFSSKVFPSKVERDIRSYIESKKMTTVDFSFEDETEKTYPVYAFKFIRSDNDIILVSDDLGKD